MALTVQEFSRLYERLAADYDRRDRLFRLVGFREPSYKRKTVAALDLRPGDTVVDIGCGTGLNFAYLQDAVGPKGRIIGVDLTPGMLAQAKNRVRQSEWENVELIQSDAAEFVFPTGVDAILSTFALTFVPGFETVIGNGFSALKSGGKFAVLDMKQPEGWPMWMVRLAVKSAAPFGVTLDLSQRRPWEVMRRYTKVVKYRAFYASFVYLAVGKKQE